MQLEELLNIDDLNWNIEDGFVNVQRHPLFPLIIYNYSKSAQFTQHWDEVTKICRGLIVNIDTQEIVARPFPKFFNYGETGAPVIDLTDPVSAFDKMDGSLGIMYTFDGGTYIATRGSFMSDQAKTAFDRLQEDDYFDFVPPKGYTLLFEIIYPQNRIVVNYGEENNLHLIGAVEIETGHILHAAHAQSISYWEGPVAQPLAIQKPFQEILNLPEREGQEGIVIYSGNKMMKIKQADYVELHRIISGLSEKYVWQWMKTKPIDDLVAEVPEEFEQWLKTTAANLFERAQNLYKSTVTDYEEIMGEEYMNWEADKTSRKDFAFKALRKNNSGLLFNLYDGRPIWDSIWEIIKPRGDTRIFAQSEDVA